MADGNCCKEVTDEQEELSVRFRPAVDIWTPVRRVLSYSFSLRAGSACEIHSPVRTSRSISRNTRPSRSSRRPSPLALTVLQRSQCHKTFGRSCEYPPPVCSYTNAVSHDGQYALSPTAPWYVQSHRHRAPRKSSDVNEVGRLGSTSARASNHAIANASATPAAIRASEYTNQFGHPEAAPIWLQREPLTHFQALSTQPTNQPNTKVAAAPAIPALIAQPSFSCFAIGTSACCQLLATNASAGMLSTVHSARSCRLGGGV